MGFIVTGTRYLIFDLVESTASEVLLCSMYIYSYYMFSSS